MINVLNVIDTGGPGGAETVFLNLSAELSTGEFHTACVVDREGWLSESLRARGIEPHIAPSGGSLNFDYLSTLLRVAKQERADVIVGHLYGSAVYSSLAGLLLRKPVISVLHGQSDISSTGRLPGLKRYVVRKGTRRMVFVSDRLKSQLRETLGLPEAQCAVIPNGIAIEEFPITGARPLRSELGISDDQILVGAVGNIRAPKAYDVLLRAAALLKRRSTRYRFVIAGEGSGDILERLLAMRAQLGLEQEVVFLGHRADVAEILSSLDVYALSSITEGFSISCIEAMASGIPVVATRSGGPEDIIEPGISGLLVPVNDPAALADAIHTVASDSALSGRLVMNGRARVGNRYTLRQMIASYESLLRAAVNR